MNQSRPGSDGGGEETSFQDHHHRENERIWQQERLHREEAYYQFINELSDEDYRLMRDHNLLGTPGEITSEELQQRLDGVKEQLASQPDLRTGTSPRDADAPQGGPREDSLLEWLNAFRRSGNAVRSGQNGNQTWRAVSWTNPSSGEFRFSLEIHINHESRGFEIHGEDPTGLPLSDVNREQRTTRQQRSSSPVARRTRSQTSVDFGGSGSNTPRTRLGSRGRTSVAGSLSTPEGSRSGAGGAGGVARTSAPRAGFGGHAQQSGGGDPRRREGQRFGAAHVWENGARTNVTVRSTNQRLEPIRLRSASGGRSRSPLRRQSGPAAARDSQRGAARGPPRGRGPARVFGRDRARGAAAHGPFPNSRLVSRITVEEGDEAGRSPRAARHPTITLDLQVRRIRPGDGRARDGVASRTRSRAGPAGDGGPVQSRGGGFRRTVSHLQRAGLRTYVSTITVPLRRASAGELAEPSSVALRAILGQIVTGFGELSSLMEAEAGPAAEARGGGPRARRAASPRGARSRDHGDEGDGPPREPDGLVETGTLPILRLAHFFLLNEGDDEDHGRGLTKEQIDNLATRNYEHDAGDGGPGKTCSVCISDYVAGSKLRRLPCAHEFHVHCIDRWLSENRTCPVCRRPVLGAGGARDA